jgi:hypothetical protein
MKPAPPRPSLQEVRDTLVLFAVPPALYLFDRVTHQDVLTAVLYIVILGSYVAWAFFGNNLVLAIRLRRERTIPKG